MRLNILLFTAMYEEMTPFVRHFNMTRNFVKHSAEHAFFTPDSTKHAIGALVTGLAGYNVARVMSGACARVKPDLVILSGVCARTSHIPLLQPVIAESVKNYSYGVYHESDTLIELQYGDLPNGRKSARIDIKDDYQGLKKAHFGSGEFFASEVASDEMTDIQAFDMESFPFVHTARKLDVPYVVIKTPTDDIRKPGGAEAFWKNLPEAAQASCEAVAQYIDQL